MSFSITRTMVFTGLITANIFLTLVNRSFFYSIIATMKYKNNLVLIIVSITIALTALVLYIKPMALFFKFEQLNVLQLLISIVAGFISVIWYEVIKLNKRMRLINP